MWYRSWLYRRCVVTVKCLHFLHGNLSSNGMGRQPWPNVLKICAFSSLQPLKQNCSPFRFSCFHHSVRGFQKIKVSCGRFPLSLWEIWFCSSLGAPIPAVHGPPRHCGCRAFPFDTFEACQTQLHEPGSQPVHDWVVCEFSSLLLPAQGTASRFTKSPLLSETNEVTH